MLNFISLKVNGKLSAILEFRGTELDDRTLGNFVMVLMENCHETSCPL
jgi:hypothetical protein